MTYNDADCIMSSIKCLQRSGHDVYVFNHGSTDNTSEIINDSGATQVYVDRSTVPNFTVRGPGDIHHFIAQFLRDHQDQYH